MTSYAADQVRDAPARSRFEMPLEGDDVAAACYRLGPGDLRVLTHTEVPAAYGGQGLATTLARGVFDLARERGFTLAPDCPFMAAWYSKHPDYADVVAAN